MLRADPPSMPQRGIDRRHLLLGLGCGLAVPRLARAQGPVVPPLSSAALGQSVAPGWQHQSLPGVAHANRFEIVADEGRRVLQVRSAASASSWLARIDAAPGRRPLLQWQWKVSGALAGSDLLTKKGDDYAARLYVLFDLPLDQLTWADRIKIQAARALSGAQVPAAALCYVWGGAQGTGVTGWNPYTDRVRMVVVDSGDAGARQWRSHSRDLRRDWAEAFPGPMPPVGAVAVGADTDNRGGQVETRFSDLVLAEAS
jgi:hypothetical protein